MSNVYTVKMPNDGIVGAFTSWAKAEKGVFEYIKAMEYDMVIEAMVKRESFQFIYTTCGNTIEIEKHRLNIWSD